MKRKHFLAVVEIVQPGSRPAAHISDLFSEVKTKWQLTENALDNSKCHIPKIWNGNVKSVNQLVDIYNI